jgi:hypothetical protein
MNERKWRQLLTAARNEPAPVPPKDFAADVLRAIHHAGPEQSPGALSLPDQLNLLFPRLAWAAAAVIALCLVADWGLTAAGVPGLADGMSQISGQWILASNGF